MIDSMCGVNCSKCELKTTCGDCLLAKCCQKRGQQFCATCVNQPCTLKAQLIAEFKTLGIDELATLNDLVALSGSFINLEYSLPTGQRFKLLDDKKIYLGTQIAKKASQRCYGLTADENFLLVSEYGNNASDPEVVIYQRRQNKTSQSAKK